jgi:sortase A
MAADGDERRGARKRTVTVALTSTILASFALTGCGDSDEPAADAAAVADAELPITDRPTTSIEARASTTPHSTSTTSTTTSTTTTVSTTSTSTSTTATATTGPIVLPEPIAPPSDEYGAEPVIAVGSIEIPAIDVYMAMYEGIRLTTLDYGPGHWPGTAMPGHIGNTVIGGHRTSKHRVFRNLDQLVPGDEIIFDGVDGRHVYHVTRTEVVGPEAMWIVDQTPAITATLFACHPPGSTRERNVVFADLAA